MAGGRKSRGMGIKEEGGAGLRHGGEDISFV